MSYITAMLRTNITLRGIMYYSVCLSENRSVVEAWVLFIQCRFLFTC